MFAMRGGISGWDLVIFVYCTVLLVAAPYTKVEESFNVQAAHDLLEFGPANLSAFDHLEFPGVVPRTFIGALLLSAIASPAHYLLRSLSWSPLVGLYLVRGVLMTLNLIALSVFRRALATKFPQYPSISTAFSLLMCTQFHLSFYLSRLLPNTFALFICALASAAYISDRTRTCLWLLAFVSAVFRCDCILLAFPMLCILLLRGKIGFQSLVLHGVAASIVSVGLTVAIDSYFWRRWLWPEGIVFFFNTVENKSSAWGTSPFHWYLSSALPRLLMPSGLLWWLPRACFGSNTKKNDDLKLQNSVDSEAVWIVLPSVVFVVLYSFLPHKELRFLFPAAPLLLGTAAIGLAKILDSGFLSRFGAKAALLLHVVAVCGFAVASITNYPGGHALSTLHQIDTHADVHSKPAVHICNLAAMSGISRFGELRDRFRYSKEENLTLGALAAHPMQFKWLISESCHSFAPGFELVGKISAFKGVQRRWPFVHLDTALCLLKRIE